LIGGTLPANQEEYSFNMPRNSNAESAANMSPDYRLEIHPGRQGLSYLFNDWLAMAENLSDPMPSHFPYWYTAFINRPDTVDTQIFFITIYRDLKLAAIFPVGCSDFRRFRLVELSIPITDALNIFPDVIVGNDENPALVFRFFLKAMKTQQDIKWDVLVVRNTLTDSHISNCIRGSKRILSMHKNTGRCNYIQIDQFRDQQYFLSKNSRANLRKARNRLDNAGTSAFECVSDSQSVRKAFKTFMKIEATGWKGKTSHDKQRYGEGGAVLLNESKLIFYQELVGTLARHGYVGIYNLILNGETIGSQIGIVLGSTCYLLKIAYNETYEKLSPGNLLLEQVIQHHAQGTRISTVNLVSDYTWHNMWKPSHLDYVTYHCFNSSWKGAVYGITMHLHSLLHRS